MKDVKRWSLIAAGTVPIMAIQLAMPFGPAILLGIVAGGLWGFVGMSLALRLWPDTEE